MKHTAAIVRTTITATVTGVAMLFATACTTSKVSQGTSQRYSSNITAPTTTSKPSSPPAVTYSIASISDIYTLWDRNQIAAIDKYNNKPIQIAGVVNGIYNDGAGRLEIEDRNDWSGQGITCNIDSSQRSALGRLSHGDSVTIHGILELTNGILDTREIEMKGCKLGSAQKVASQYHQTAPSSNSSPLTRNRATPPNPQTPLNEIERVCRVNDADDTYVNLRATPNGQLIGPVDNGTVVTINGSKTDKRGREWASVKTSTDQYGFMYRGMISCG